MFLSPTLSTASDDNVPDHGGAIIQEVDANRGWRRTEGRNKGSQGPCPVKSHSGFDREGKDSAVIPLSPIAQGGGVATEPVVRLAIAWRLACLGVTDKDASIFRPDAEHVGPSAIRQYL